MICPGLLTFKRPPIKMKSDILSSPCSILAKAIGKVVKHTENEHKSYMLREEQGPSEEEIDMFSKRITLTEIEKKIIDLLNECKNAIDSKLISIPSSTSILYEHHRFIKGSTLDNLQPILFPESITLRFAGGWVRDKLLKIDSSDIDISIDSMTGEKFASIFCSFVKQKGLPVSSVAIVAARPDQSKHLETACLSLFDQKIDFVNLRSEMYSETSRIPTKMIFGSPSDDAHRRDITINSLFYNIHTGKVEDWTGRGLRDLSVGLVRTPLPPASIFIDDPLRILRVVRFASRFSYQVDPEITDSLINSPRIRHLLYEKISRERIGIEIKKMLTGPNPFLSLSLIWNFKIWPCVFWSPIFITNLHGHSQFEDSLSKYESHTMQKGWIYSQILENLLKRLPLYNSFLITDNSYLDSREIGIKRVSFPLLPELIYILYLCATFLPHQGFIAYKSSTDKSSKIPVSSFLCKYSLKITNIEEEHISSIVENAHYFIELLDSIGSHNIANLDFSTLCSCLRLVGPRWEISWIVAHLLAIEKMIFTPATNTVFLEGDNVIINVLDSFLNDVCVSFAHIHTKIITYGLDKLWTLKPILNGNQIIKLFQFSKGNSHIQRLLCELVVWQIRQNIIESNPENIESASKYLKNLYETRPEIFSNTSYPIKIF